MGFEFKTEHFGRFTWEWNEENNEYECRGEVMYDDEHDETPEPALWNSAHELAAMLLNNGWHSRISHSEKGWVEVQIVKKAIGTNVNNVKFK